MIHIWAPGLGYPSKETRYGDGQIVSDGKNFLVIDGFCGYGTQVLIKKLKSWKIKEPYLAITHAHYDHAEGIFQIIKDSYFTPKALWCYDPDTLTIGLNNNAGSREVKSDINYLSKIINAAKAKNIPIKYLKNNQNIVKGDIKIKVYREQPTRVVSDDTEGWAYVNDGSLCFYFPEINYWTSGDGPQAIFNLIKKTGAKVKFFKIPHHGNNCSQSQAKGLKNAGAVACWYNDLEPNGVGTNDFTLYGARRCKQAGLKVLESKSDINMLFYSGKAHIWHNGREMANYSCAYQGDAALKVPSANIIRNIFMNKYGTGDTRITNLIKAGYFPKIANEKVTLVITVANSIINKKTNYGKNQERIANLDKKFGKGYGQLIQDEINSLLKSKNAKW